MLKEFFLKTFFVTFIFFTPLLANAEGKKPYTILFLGDSLTEGIGIDPKKNYPSLVESKLKKKGLNVKIINGGVSGSTTASAPSRLKWYKRVIPDMVVIALGANDGLRGLQVDEMEKNLGTTIEEAQKSNIKVVLAGMKVPTNYGEDYTKAYDEVFNHLVVKYNIGFIPFLLKDVALIREMNLSDGIHPNEKGHEKISETVLATVLPLIVKESKQD
ncbi:MAG: arylesterase [Nitrospinae bacterium]|nr:arylesterase [Nitrospinota bacterium]